MGSVCLARIKSEQGDDGPKDGGSAKPGDPKMFLSKLQQTLPAAAFKEVSLQHMYLRSSAASFHTLKQSLQSSSQSKIACILCPLLNIP